MKAPPYSIVLKYLFDVSLLVENFMFPKSTKTHTDIRDATGLRGCCLSTLVIFHVRN